MGFVQDNWKQFAKQAVRRSIGEPYVGKRLKSRCLNRVMGDLALAPKNILEVESTGVVYDGPVLSVAS